MKFKLFIIFTFSCLLVQAQDQREVWLDSMKSDSYIGMEVMMNDLQVKAKADSNEAAAFGFYKNNPLNTTEDVLSRLSGVSMIRRGNYAWEPTINGLSSGQINVNIDGMRIFGACTDKMDPVTSYVEPNNLQSVAITKGSGGHENGCSVGGAVTLKMQKPKFQNQWSGSLASRYESVAKGVASNGSINYGGQRLALRISGGIRRFEDYKDGTGNEVYYSQFKKMNLSIGAAIRLKNENLIHVDALLDDAKDVGYPALPMDVSFAKARILGVEYTIWNPLPSIGQVNIKAYYNQIRHAMDDTHRPDAPMHMDMPGQTETFGAFGSSQMVKGVHHINGKLEFYRTTAKADMTMYMPNESSMYLMTWPEINRQSVVGFLSDQLHLKNQWQIGINAAVEVSNTSMTSEMGQRQFGIFGYQKGDFDLNKSVLNIGLSAKHQFSDQMSAMISANHGGRLPSMSELYGFYLFNAFDGYDYIGNPNLKNEISNQLLFSLDSKVNDKLEFNIEGFNYWFDNYIMGQLVDFDPMTIGARGVKSYTNVSGVMFSGFDVRVAYSPFSFLQVLAQTKYTYAQDGDRNAMPLVPPLKNYLTVVYQIKSTKVQLEGEWSSAQNRISESAGEKATNSYFVSNLRITQAIKLNQTRLDISLGGENIFDEAYRQHLDWGNILRPGRNIYLSVNWVF